jgi:hypothetical protein
MTDPNIIYSGLCKTVELEGRKFRIEIIRLEDKEGWLLEVVDEEGTSTVWDELYPTDHAALAEVTKAIDEEGLSAFLDGGNVVPFPKR